MKIGIICPSEIAYRRFMPALKKVDGLEFAGLGICTREERFYNSELNEVDIDEVLKSERNKAEIFVKKYGGKIYEGYEKVVSSNEIDAVYIPLPPALHYKWAKLALKNGKHVLVEKPSTISAQDSRELIDIANNNGLALHENYMFLFHSQLKEINDVIKSGQIGEVRLFRINFGFPLREQNDFRYNKSLGGGALIDAGGYTLKYATQLLGTTAYIASAHMNYKDGYEVDMYGSAVLINENGVTVQVAFGMDNNYKCELEVWGSLGCLNTDRVITAPADFVPKMTIRKGNDVVSINLSSDDAFLKSIKYFVTCIRNEDTRKESYKSIMKQAELVEQFKQMSNSK